MSAPACLDAVVGKAPAPMSGCRASSNSQSGPGQEQPSVPGERGRAKESTGCLLQQPRHPD